MSATKTVDGVKYSILTAKHPNSGVGEFNIQFIPDDHFEFYLPTVNAWARTSGMVEIVGTALDFASEVIRDTCLRCEPHVLPLYDWRNEEPATPSSLVVFIKYDNNGTTLKVLVEGFDFYNQFVEEQIIEVAR